MSKTTKTKNDVAWEHLFDRHQILGNIERDGYFVISSEQINVFREARLMTKFDHRNNLPTLFRDNELSILPTKRGEYVISQFDAYQTLPQPAGKPINMPFPDHIQSLDYRNITSESAAINCAYITDILADFVEDAALLPTVSGRMGSDHFKFNIRNTQSKTLVEVAVENSQIEVDGGYEGVDFLTLIEAKNAVSDDFLVRQIYYPFRLFARQLTKPIKNLFLIYTNGIFHVYQYEFGDPYNYNSLELIKQQSYSIEPEEITLDDILTIRNSLTSVPEPEGVPFPQADSFERVINLCEILYERGSLSRDDVTTEYDFNVRQTNYYTDAARYLGFVEKISTEEGGITYTLTARGMRLFETDFKNRQLAFVEAILEHPVFHQSLNLYLQKADVPTKAEIVDIMRRANLPKIGADSTFGRRASTVSAWIDWILRLQT